MGATMGRLFVIWVFVIVDIGCTVGISRRCYQCRSRGAMGDCKDPFAFNETTVGTTGIKASPCPSGWCSKFIEGITGPPDEFGTATERGCMGFPPTDGEERCAIIPRNGKKTYACFCQGDLCNSAPATTKSHNQYVLYCISSLLLTLRTLLLEFQ